MTNLPKIVYKYRNWNDQYHKDILYKNEIFMASAKDFNDPFDCRISQNFSLLTQKEKNQYVEELTMKLFPNNISENINIIRKKTQDESFQEERDNIEFDLFEKYYGILALSCRWNSVLLWSHYADKHKGYCVGFFEEKLRSSLLTKAVGYGLVNYQENFPKLKPKVLHNHNDPEIAKNRIAKTLTKSVDWTYEEEYRIFTNYFNFYPEIPDTSIRIEHFSDDVISEVILGMNMENSSHQEIISICKCRNIKVFQAKKDNLRFEINRELIE